MKILLILCFLFSLLFQNIWPEKHQILLKREKIFHEDDVKSDIFFKSAPNMIVENNLLIIPNNFGDNVLFFKIGKRLILKKVIGQKGQGPGDLYLPQDLATWRGIIAVRDEIGFSFFKYNGKYLDKFRFFKGGSSFLFLNNKIFYLNNRIDESPLIEVYSRRGKKLAQFGEKFLKPSKKFKRSKYKSLYGLFMYSGRLVYDGNYIFYFNSKFGNVLKFSTNGDLKKSLNISEFYKAEGSKIIKKNSELYLSENIDETKKRFPNYFLFKDVCYASGYFYILGREYSLSGKRNAMVEILKLDVNEFKLKDEYFFKLKEKERIYTFAVSGRSGFPSFFFAMSVEDGNAIIIGRERISNEI